MRFYKMNLGVITGFKSYTSCFQLPGNHDYYFVLYILLYHLLVSQKICIYNINLNGMFVWLSQICS